MRADFGFLHPIVSYGLIYSDKVSGVNEYPRVHLMKIIQLEYARAVAALAVMCFHIEITFAKEKYMGVPTIPFFSSGDSGVQIFFVLSGFVIYLAHRAEPVGSLEAVSEFCRRRLVRVAVPLWIVLSLLLIASLIGVVPTAATFSDYINAFTIVPTGSEPVLSVEWTLRHEILFYTLFAIAVYNRWLGAGILVVWATLGLFLGAIVDPSSGWRIVFSTNNFLFLAGIILCKLYLGGLDRRFLTIGALGVLIFGATALGCLYGVITKNISNIAYGLGAAMVLAGSLTFPTFGKRHEAILAIASASYSLYLIHFPLVSLMSKALTQIGGGDYLPIRIFYFFLTAAVCIVSALAFHSWIERPVVRWLNRRSAKVVVT